MRPTTEKAALNGLSGLCARFQIPQRAILQLAANWSPGLRANVYGSTRYGHEGITVAILCLLPFYADRYAAAISVRHPGASRRPDAAFFSSYGIRKLAGRM